MLKERFHHVVKQTPTEVRQALADVAAGAGLAPDQADRPDRGAGRIARPWRCPHSVERIESDAPDKRFESKSTRRPIPSLRGTVLGGVIHASSTASVPGRPAAIRG